MVGVVVVSHSRALAEAVVALARQLADESVPLLVAAGTSDGGFGTDATRIADAVDRAFAQSTAVGPAGVLVLMDIGSAVLSAELALEFSDADPASVRLCPGPLVEGALAAAVAAAGGADLDETEREAVAGLSGKAEHLGGTGQPDRSDASPAAEHAPRDQPAGHRGAGDQTPAARDVTVINADGLHARPAARLVAAVRGYDASLTVHDSQGGSADARSPTGLARLHVQPGDRLRITGEGVDAHRAVDAIVALVEDGFGDGPVDTVADAEETRTPTGQGADTPGRGASPGCGAGPAWRAPGSPAEPDARTRLPSDQRAAAEEALQRAAEAVADRLRRVAADLDEPVAGIIRAEAEMALDPAVLADARRVMRDGRTAPRAVWEAFGSVAERFRAAGGRIAERVEDLVGVRDLMLAELAGRAAAQPQPDGPYVLVAGVLTPVVAAGLDPNRCRGIVSEHGGPTSHVAIIARKLGIPAVLGLPEAAAIEPGRRVLVDGSRGAVELDPED